MDSIDFLKHAFSLAGFKLALQQAKVDATEFSQNVFLINLNSNFKKIVTSDKYFTIIALGHCSLLLYIWKSRHSETLIVTNIFFFSFLALLTGPLNSLLRNNFQLVATKNYFDTSGAFIGLTYAVPMIVYIVLNIFLLFGIIISTMKHNADVLRQMRKKR
jgi:hypothetical protein